MEHSQFSPVYTEGEFTLWVNSPIYKTYVAGEGYYIRNINTGQNCGREVVLRKRFYLNGEKLQKPILDEDCYEVASEEKNK